MNNAPLILVLLAAALSGCSEEGPHLEDPRLAAAREAGEQLAKQGGGGVPPCVSCHGLKGEGIGVFPRLAAQHPLYLYRQLEDLARTEPAEGESIKPITQKDSATQLIHSDLTAFPPGVRHDPVMSPIVGLLTEEARRNLAIYFASLPFDATPVEADGQTLEQGQDLALRGKAESGLPACVTCHGPNGEGFEADFPPLAGQPAAYLITQIDHWQSGLRDNGPQRLMRAVANQLTDADKANVAAYFANRASHWPGYQGDWPWSD
ncbi:c-type cytochrome [Thiorhodovibrio frisius]|uniref:Cytochrome c553 n=1 Tax=Thiorhodovibrio frisius TaxID=631362 RepID=H8Z394_9GAMM|nr:c-type cytochrome [Thiorhodovibrio frisius]EIC21802.1 cytochrome c553 [Thiorhodovibrio frisius]WPL21772.1 Cytochrome c4 [Thiorhodovibrio frisius]